MTGLLDTIASRPVLVVAAHPDDEILGAAAAMVELPDVTVIHVTDGAPRDGADAERDGFASWAEYAAARREEAAAALALVGIARDRILGLGLPDQQATYHLVPLAHRLATLLRQHDRAALITHSYEGGHPDHDAVALAAHAARRLLARDGCSEPEIIEMTGYHAGPGGVVSGDFLPNEDAGPITTLVLSEERRRLKRRMLDCHATQHAVLASFGIDQERFRRAPRYDFQLPPHAGPLNYDRQPWGITAESWRAHAAAAARALDLEGAF